MQQAFAVLECPIAVALEGIFASDKHRQKEDSTDKIERLENGLHSAAQHL